MESAKAYRKRVAIPIVSRLIDVVRDLYLKLQQERKRRQQLLTAYDRDTRIWKERAEVVDEVNDKAAWFDRLSKMLGVDRIQELLEKAKEKERGKNGKPDRSMER